MAARRAADLGAAQWLRIANSRPFAGLNPLTQPGELTEHPPTRRRA
ncbi:hypothetical protein LRS03_26225 [Rhizobacter sp. J219]|nr:hypothetical protein [Rhizobacter sp. J219]MCR5886158.1 hypothetical protein [Rhizobacter sp. J219]